MNRKFDKRAARAKRHARIRKKVYGVPGKERLCVFRSLNHIYAQVIDDSSGTTVCSASSLSAELRAEIKNGGNTEAARQVGRELAGKCREKGIERVVFDRSGYPYHGRIKALSEGAREEGLIF